MGKNKNGHEVLERLGRYALIYHDHKETPYIVVSGYNKTYDTWQEEKRCSTYSEAVNHYRKLVTAYCSQCLHRFNGCVSCKDKRG